MLIYIIYITFRDIWMTIYTITMVWDIHSLDIPVIWDHHLGFLYIIHITFRDIYISHMLHGAGIFTYIRVFFWANVGKYSSTMEHIWVYIYIYK